MSAVQASLLLSAAWNDAGTTIQLHRAMDLDRAASSANESWRFRARISGSGLQSRAEFLLTRLIGPGAGPALVKF